mgnify:CR=1 FL=1
MIQSIQSCFKRSLQLEQFLHRLHMMFLLQGIDQIQAFVHSIQTQRIKLSQLSLTYDIPLRTSVLQGLSVWASVNNLFTLTPYLGADPEFYYGNTVLTQGIDYGLQPSCRSFSFGVKLNL